MKSTYRKTFSFIVAFALLLSLSIPALAEEQKVSSFDDVPSDHWAYTPIMAMTEKGLFSGKENYGDGTAIFAPQDTMSRAEFITVVVRYLYPEELKAQGTTSPWYQGAYDVALANGLLKTNELDKGNLATPMNRQEMAMVLVRAANIKGESPTQLIDTARIPDYNTKIGDYYKDYVVQCYSMGMLCGTSADGVFSPTVTLNRATAATVLYRLIEPSARQKVDFTKPETPTSGPITIYEGQSRSNRLAQVGDTVIKADGTKVVLQLGKDGILGQDQGVAPDLGYQAFPNATSSQIVSNHSVFAVGEIGLKDSLGNSVNNRSYKVNPYTGMGAWSSEWSHIIDKHPKPEADGTKDEQLSADSYWVWSSMVEDWILACNM